MAFRYAGGVATAEPRPLDSIARPGTKSDKRFIGEPLRTTTMMLMIRRRIGLSVAIMLLMIVAVCSGCGTSAYEDQMQKAQRSLAAEQQPPAEADDAESDEAAQ